MRVHVEGRAKEGRVVVGEGVGARVEDVGQGLDWEEVKGRGYRMRKLQGGQAEWGSEVAIGIFYFT